MGLYLGKGSWGTVSGEGGGMHGQGIFNIFRQNWCYLAIFRRIEQHGSAEVPV